MIVGAMSDLGAAHRLDQWRPGGGLERYRCPATSDDIDCLVDPFDSHPERIYLAHRSAGHSHDTAMSAAAKYF